MAGSKRTREDTSGVSFQEGNDGPSSKHANRGTRSASQAQHAEAGGHEINETQRLDTAASPAQPGHTIHAPLLLPPRPRQNLATTMNKLSTLASKHLDAQAHARFLHDIRADDDFAEAAYQYGLLATFIITSPSMASGSSPPFEVEAPDLASVEYLKRRITKAKLLISDELYVYDRFALRRMPTPGAHGQEAAQEMRMLDEKTPLNIPMLLCNLGFRGGETYHVSMISRASNNDKAQQEHMIREAATAGARRIIPLDDPVAREYQEVLNGGPLNQEPPRAPVPRIVAAPAARSPFPVANRVLSPLRGTFIPSPAAGGVGTTPTGSGPTALPSAGNDGGQFAHSPVVRGRAGRWSVTEIEALVGGVHDYGYNWAMIREHCGDVIDSRRTNVDLKDKWINLVKVVTEGKPTRTILISENLKAVIDQLAKREDARYNQQQ